jgi:hypothetical protein
VRVRRHPIRHRAPWLVVATACALTAPTFSGGQTSGRVKATRVVLVKDAAVQAVAASNDYLAWARGPFSGRSRRPLPVLERPRSTRRTRKLAHDSFPQFGLATTSDWVVYAKSAGREIRLVAVRHDGSDRTMTPNRTSHPRLQGRCTTRSAVGGGAGTSGGGDGLA